jgi:ribosomal protein L27
VTVNADGTITYTPDPDFHGVDRYTYTVTSDGVSETATVTITVTPVNDPPEAVADDGGTLRPGREAVFAPGALLHNDRDVDGDPLGVVTVDPTSANGGTVVLRPDGTVAYTPRPGFVGPDSFRYTISDGRGGFSTATVRVLVASDTYVAPPKGPYEADPFRIDQREIGYPDFTQPFEPALFVLPAVSDAFAVSSEASDATGSLGIHYAGELGSRVLAGYESLTPGQFVLRQGVAHARELGQLAAARSGALLNTLLPGAQTLFDDFSPFGPRPATGEGTDTVPAEPAAEGTRQTEAVPPRGAPGFSQQLRAESEKKIQRLG